MGRARRARGPLGARWALPLSARCPHRPVDLAAQASCANLAAFPVPACLLPALTGGPQQTPLADAPRTSQARSCSKSHGRVPREAEPPGESGERGRASWSRDRVRPGGKRRLRWPPDHRALTPSVHATLAFLQ